LLTLYRQKKEWLTKKKEEEVPVEEPEEEEILVCIEGQVEAELTQAEIDAFEEAGAQVELGECPEEIP